MVVRSLMVLIMAVAMTETSIVTHPVEEHAFSSARRAMVSDMLIMTGSSDTCVAIALDVCSTGQGGSFSASLIGEAREVVQQTSAAITKWDSQLSAAVNSIKSQLSAAVNKSEPQLSAVENKCEFQSSAAENIIETMISAAVNESESQLSAIVNIWDTKLSAALDKLGPRPRHCKDLLVAGDRGNGPRQVYPYPNRPLHKVTVVCDQTTDGGGWTVFQRRTSNAKRQDFMRTWREYQDGFGDLEEGEFWLGFNVLHQLTSSTPNQLRIELDDYEGGRRWAKYGNFAVGGPETNYLLNVTEYSGDTGDSLAYNNGRPFSTHDADHDNNSLNCAAVHKGPWWWWGPGCTSNSNLNGYHYVGNNVPGWQGIYWAHWRGQYSMKKISMKTRPHV